MTAEVRTLDASRVEVSGSLSADEFQKYIAETMREIARETEIDGFRKGKAPERLVVEKVGEEALLNRAAQNALRKLWPDILKKNAIEAIGPAEFHILKLARGNELLWKVVVSVLPKVALPDYKTIAGRLNAKKDTAPPEITEKEIEETLAYIHKSRGTEKPLDDAFAASLGNFSTLEALKKSIRDGIGLEKEAKRHEEHRMKILAEIIHECAIEIPEIMRAREIERMTEELKSSTKEMGLAWDQYLAHLKKSEDDLKRGWIPDAEKRSRYGLVLREIAKQENLSPLPDEVERRAKEVLHQNPELDREHVNDYAYGVVRNEKVFAFLESC